MKVIVFDLMPYGEDLSHLGTEGVGLPYPLGRQHFRPEVAVATYREHLECWEEMDRLGFDGIGINEHHCSPYGLMNSPNLLAAAVAQRTNQLKILIFGNLLPLHDPLRLAEELAMLDCLSDGRIISGFARGIPREYNVFGVPMPESRARFEEAAEIIVRAWTEEVFSFDGRFWSYKDVAIWPRPVQQPHPPIWLPVTVSKESIEWAAARNVPIATNGPRGLCEDIFSYYASCLEANGTTLTADHAITAADVYVADSKAQALKELAPYRLYFSRMLFSHGNVTETKLQQASGYVSEQALDYVRPENRPLAARNRSEYRNLTFEDLEAQADRAPWGPPEEVAARLIAEADQLGTSTVLVSLNRGAMSKELFLEQIRRFGTEVLPILHAHEVAPGVKRAAPTADSDLAFLQ
ncbi:MAG: LLM class flavin-dependent oxidoreductase [Actinomycetota bacterium]|nr:LLM class flavin-dependent oxidoreductase [Actinomycetota bacterium]